MTVGSKWWAFFVCQGLTRSGGMSQHVEYSADRQTHVSRAIFCLALPLLMCRWLDARSWRQYRLQAQRTG